MTLKGKSQHTRGDTSLWLFTLNKETSGGLSKERRKDRETTHLEQVHHLGVELRALRQGVEDEVVYAADAVSVEEVRPAGVEEQVAVPPEKPCSRSGHLSIESV